MKETKYKIISIFLLICCTFLPISAQKWHFGYNNYIEFSNNSISTGLSNINAPEGCSVGYHNDMSVAFYTNGVTLWNDKGDTIPISLKGHVSSTQSALVLPFGNDSWAIVTNTNLGRQNGAMYSIINYRDSEFYAELLNVPILEFTTEKMAACKVFRQNAYFIALTKMNTDSLYIYKLNDNGDLTQQSVFSFGKAITGHSINTMGEMKFSLDAKYLAFVHSANGGIVVAEFDNENGMLKKFVNYTQSSIFAPYGLSFTTDNKYLLFSNSYQFPSICYIDIVSQKFEFPENVISNQSQYSFGSIQLGFDNRYYIAQADSKYLSIIEYKDSKFEFIQDAVELKSISTMGLPNLTLDIILDNFDCKDWAKQIKSYGENGSLLLGNSSLIHQRIDVNQALPFQSSLFIIEKPYLLNSNFTIDVQFSFDEGNDYSSADGGSQGADGIAVLLLKDKPKEVGLYAGGIGYKNLSNGLAIEFDTYYNSSALHNDPNTSHLGIFYTNDRFTANHQEYDHISTSLFEEEFKADGRVYDFTIYFDFEKKSIYILYKGEVLMQQVIPQFDEFFTNPLYLALSTATGSAVQSSQLHSLTLCPQSLDLAPSRIVYQREEQETNYKDLKLIGTFDIMGRNVEGNMYKSNMNNQPLFQIFVDKSGNFTTKKYFFSRK